MPTELDKQVVTFTESGEVAIRRAVHRVESRLRSSAIDEAVRQRGFPAEVTSSDVERASRHFATEFVSRTGATERFDPLSAEYMLRDRITLQRYRDMHRRRTSVFERVGSIYTRVGVSLVVGGVVVPTLYMLYKSLSHDFAWRIGLMTAAAGLAMTASGFILREVASRGHIVSPRQYEDRPIYKKTE